MPVPRSVLLCAVTAGAFAALAVANQRVGLALSVALLFVIGVGLLLALRRASLSVELALVAAGTAASLAAIDVAWYLNGRLPPIYLLDAAAEIVFLAAGIVAWASLRGGTARSP